MQRPPSSHGEEHHHSHDSRDKPKQHIDQVNPHCVLHPFDPTVALRIRMDVQLPEDTEDGSPQYAAQSHTLAEHPTNFRNRATADLEALAYKSTTSQPNAQ